MIKRIGFTLIELIVVILILGILAAVAVPRFIDLRSQANVAALMGLRAAVISTADLAHGLHLAAGIPVDAAVRYVTIEGTLIGMIYGYPRSSYMDRAVRFDSSTFNAVATGGGMNFQVTGANDPTHCQLFYYSAIAPNNAAPRIDTLTDGC